MVKRILDQIGPREIFGLIGISMLGWGLWLVHPVAMYVGLGSLFTAIAIFGRTPG